MNKDVIPSSAESLIDQNESKAMYLEITHDSPFKPLEESESSTPSKDTSGERENNTPQSMNISPFSSPLERIQPAGIVAEISQSNHSKLWFQCEKCGSANLRDNSLRLMLNLDPIWPIPWNQTRIIQRRISNSTYVLSKIEELDKLKSNERDLKNSYNMNLVREQIESLSVASLQREDFLIIESLSSSKRVREGFKTNHFKMLFSLYNEKREDIFEDCKTFLRELPQISQVKDEMGIASRVWKRSNKINLKEQNGNTANELVGNILGAQFNQSKKSFESKIAPHYLLQSKVQSELKSLYEDLNHLRESNSNIASSSFILTTVREYDEKLSTLQSKIFLWRLLSKTIAAVLLSC
eukprot:TRINITY_DN6476_c0_g1_i1.p1 TRINITY_DN6476_c0_g1~~TRINITY_DN6476_c0_g1_i1.p1  ORF type:complete len:353 (-),score=97.57 TRINITY_DN6476_c0_g1_i1:221-1279(-)